MLTDFLNLCWESKGVPAEWHEAFVTVIYKKGAIDQCENYRPISLLNIGYKTFAALMLARLVEAGAEERLSSAQFGFRSKCFTVDAVFVLLRRLDTAIAQRNGKLVVLALDWQKAFDSIDPDAMIAALRRFGLPNHVLEMIRAIYSDRHFRVRDCGHTSRSRPQGAGISQGCPLSPFLFVMLMTVLMSDAQAKLPQSDKDRAATGILASLLYADDTLLLGVEEASLQRFMAAVAEVGATYGLQLHWGKLQQLNVRCNARLRQPSGTPITPNEQLTYLGGIISDDGRIQKSLGLAQGSFRELSRVWKHSSMGRRRKLLLFNALVVPRLMYALQVAWLNKAERRKLDGFQNRCLRSLWGIKPVFRITYEQRRSPEDNRAATTQPTLGEAAAFILR